MSEVPAMLPSNNSHWLPTKLSLLTFPLINRCIPVQIASPTTNQSKSLIFTSLQSTKTPISNPPPTKHNVHLVLRNLLLLPAPIPSPLLQLPLPPRYPSRHSVSRSAPHAARARPGPAASDPLSISPSPSPSPSHLAHPSESGPGYIFPPFGKGGTHN